MKVKKSKLVKLIKEFLDTTGQYAQNYDIDNLDNLEDASTIDDLEAEFDFEDYDNLEADFDYNDIVIPEPDYAAAQQELYEKLKQPMR